MKHLAVDEMIDFVSINKLNDESLKLASVVNAHILHCDMCRKKVESFQVVYDELVKLGEKEDFGKIVNKRTNNEKQTEKQLDGFR